MEQTDRQTEESQHWRYNNGRVPGKPRLAGSRFIPRIVE